MGWLGWLDLPRTAAIEPRHTNPQPEQSNQLRLLLPQSLRLHLAIEPVAFVPLQSNQLALHAASCVCNRTFARLDSLSLVPTSFLLLFFAPPPPSPPPLSRVEEEKRWNVGAFSSLQNDTYFFSKGNHSSAHTVPTRRAPRTEYQMDVRPCAH
jgi:hypothetical protein